MTHRITSTSGLANVAGTQALLNLVSAAGLAVDGMLGPLTATALRHFQAAQGLPQSGQPDAETLVALQAANPQLALSDAGRHFIYQHEAQAGVSDRLYWPGGDSGVTLGAGYDMSGRDATAITSDLGRLALPAALCASAGQAAGLVSEAAEAFAEQHADLIRLTPDQEEELLKSTVPPYEAIVRRDIKVKLAQHQFDALVSFVYNPGGSFHPVATLINAGDAEAACRKMSGRVFSGRKRLEDLIRRRQDETSLYLTGRYGQ